jgi:hypothetical protein
LQKPRLHSLLDCHEKARPILGPAEIEQTQLIHGPLDARVKSEEAPTIPQLFPHKTCSPIDTRISDITSEHDMSRDKVLASTIMLGRASQLTVASCETDERFREVVFQLTEP